MRQGDRESRSFLARYIALACVSGTSREMGFRRNLDGSLKLPMNFAAYDDIDMPRGRGSGARGRKRIVAVYRGNATHKGMAVILSFLTVGRFSWYKPNSGPSSTVTFVKLCCSSPKI